MAESKDYCVPSLISQQTFLVIKKKFTLVYPEQNLKFAVVTTKNRLKNNVIETIPNYPSSTVK